MTDFHSHDHADNSEEDGMGLWPDEGHQLLPENVSPPMETTTWFGPYMDSQPTISSTFAGPAFVSSWNPQTFDFQSFNMEGMNTPHDHGHHVYPDGNGDTVSRDNGWLNGSDGNQQSISDAVNNVSIPPQVPAEFTSYPEGVLFPEVDMETASTSASQPASTNMPLSSSTPAATNMEVANSTPYPKSTSAESSPSTHSRRYTCKPCSFSSNIKRDFKRHQNTRKHHDNLQASNHAHVSNVPGPGSSSNGATTGWFCPVQNCRFANGDMMFSREDNLLRHIRKVHVQSTQH